MCMKSEARGPIVHLHCSSDADCQYRPCADKCGCICIDSLCQCSKPSFLDNVHTHPPTNWVIGLLHIQSPRLRMRTMKFCNFIVFKGKVVLVSYKWNKCYV